MSSITSHFLWRKSDRNSKDYKQKGQEADIVWVGRAYSVRSVVTYCGICCPEVLF